jgi:hypothetical protein
MKKKMLLAFQILTIIIILLLALSTFFIQHDNPENYSDNFFVKLFSLDHYYHSPLNLVLFSLMALLMLVPVFFKTFKSKLQIVLHLVIVFAFVLIIYDKTMNFRDIMPLNEKQSINFSEIVDDENYNQTIYLDEFIIEYHNGSRMPKAFTSKLIINNSDSVLLNVNKPVEIGKYRLYQNAYDIIPVYKLIFDKEEYLLSFGEKMELKDHVAYLTRTKNPKKMVFHFNEQEFVLSTKGGTFAIEEFSFDLSLTEESKYTSIIEVASVTGMKFLLVVGLGYLVTLGYIFWSKK